VSARIDNNEIRDNASAGLSLVISDHAEITENYIVANGGIGVELTRVAGRGDPIARVTGNTITGNTLEGLLISQLSEVQIVANTIRENGGESNLVIEGPGGFAMVQDNTVQASMTGNGMRLTCLTADISGGEVSDNAIHGILLGFGSDFLACPEASPTLATISCTGAPLTVARNGGAGIQVDSGSLAQLNQARILFDRNVGGNVSGGGQVAFCPE
jgi:hypothetical protein